MEKIWKINLIAIIFILILVGTVNATWWNTSYGYRKQINIQGGISTLSNFTVLINVSFLTGKMQATFTDLRFVSGSCNTSSQDTLLSYEFDKVVNSNGVYVWVKIPSLTTGTNSICMYYNNPSADSGQDPLNTWDKNYMGVYHFTEGTGSTTTDSTGHKNGTLGVGVSWNTSSGFIGNAVQMGGDNTNYINLSDNTFLKWQHPPVTFESLLTAATDGAYMGIVGNDHPATEWYWARGPDQMRYGNDVGGWLISNEEPINIKRYTAFSYANNDMHIKIDSQESIQAVTSTLGPATGSIYIGYSPGLAGGTGSWSGTLDEVRISNISRNQAWINRSQMNWNGTLFTFDGEEKGPTAPPTVNLSIPIDYYNSTSTTVIFNCSAVDETPILNLTLVINDIDNSTIVNATAGQNLSLQVSKVMNNGNYNWSCKSSNLAGSEGLSVNRTLTVDTFPSAILNTPANGSIKNTPQNYTANLTDGTGLLNATLYIYNSTDDLVNETTTSFGVGTLTTIVGVVVSLVDGVYHWFYQVFDTFGQSTISSVNNTITIDTISPIISIVYPLNGTHYSKDIIEINYTIYDVSIGSCWYSIDNGVTNTTITCGNNITGVNASVSGTYNWSVWANNTTNNTITEALTTFIIDKESPTITWYNPTTGSHPIVKTAFILNVSIFDSYLDAVNVSVINITGDYIYTNLTEGIIDTLFWVNYTIPLNEGNNTVEICARDSLTGSPEIQAKAIFTKVDETKTTFDSSISRTLQIYDSKDILLSTRDYNLNTTDIWVDGGKHYKTTWEMINIPKDSYIKIILTNEKGRMDLLTDRGITRIVDSDRKYYWRFDDMEKAGFEVKYEQDHNNVNVIVKQGSYVPITKDLTSKFILDPITGGLNTKCENETIIYDTTPPYVNITYPINKTYKTDVTAINYTYSDINMAYCWYSTDNGVTNNTVVCGTNVTGLTSNQGSNTWIVGVNDTVGNLNQSKITFFKDTIIPIINLTYPINKTYDKVITEINFTYIETNVGTCWYSTDGGIINMSSKSLSWCYQESANVSTACGGLDTGVYYGITANWVNPQLVIDGDWSTKGDGPAGYVENISVNYTKPTNATAALWQYKSRYDPPTNITIPSSCFNYYTDVIDLMIQSECIGTPLCHDYAKFYCRNASGLSLIKTSSMGGWIYEEAINWEVTQDETSKCLNITNLYSSEGSNNWLIGINDTLGNENMSAVTFYVDSLKPSISIFSPVNNTNQSDAGMDINYSVVDVHLDSCWYSNDTFTLNTTLSGCSNITTISWSEGQHNITIWANDTYGHTGSASVRFYIDTTYPLIEFGIGTPVNYANMSQNSIYINTSWSDDYYANVTFNLYNSNHALTSSTTYTDLTKFHNFTGISEGYYYYNVTITDAVNHKNSTTTRKILLDITGPSASVGYTDSGSYSVGTNNSYTNKSAVNFTTNVTDVYGIKNITITIKNSTGDVINKTTQTFTDTVLYYLFGVPLTLIDGVYNWIVEAWDNSFNQIRTYTPPTDTSPNNLIAYWKFDETSGTTAVDSVAGKYNFTVGNSTSWVAGKRGNAYLCNDTDFINTTYVPAGLTEFSINIWIKRSGSWVGNHWLLSNRDGDGSFIIETSGSGITSKLFGDGGVPGSGTTATPDASLNTWEMFTITFNSTGSSVYMNGSYIDTKAWTISSGLNESANIFFLSAQDGTTPFVNAIFDEMAFWNKSLTSTEVSNMYDVASPALTITVDTTPGIVTSQNTTSTQYNDVTIYKLNASITELNINSTGVEFEGTNFSITNTTTTHYEYNFSKNLTYVPYKSPFYFWVKDLAGLYTISSTYYFNVLCPNDRSLLTNTSNGFCMEKIEFTGNQNITRYINISTSLAAITSAYINLSGFNSSNVLWPYNVSLRVGDIYVWNYTGNFTHANNKTTDFASAINKYMNSTYVIGSNYVIPITFNSGTKGVIEYNVVTITSDNILENNVSYNNPVYETAREYYYINLTYDSSAYTSILGTLYYNDIAYTGTKTGTGSNVQFAASLDIPANLANRTFYWRIALTNSSSTYYTYTANRTQNITTVIFSICNATHNVTYLNFTFLDESAITIKLNATNDLSDFDFWLGNGTTTKNYIYQNTSLNWEYDFCMTPSDKTITAALFFKYANVGQGYPLRTYQTASITLTNVSTKKTLYLLGTSSGAIYSSIRTAAISGAAISGVTITYERQIGGVWTLIGEEVTGDDGIATFWVDPNYQYRFTATKSGYTTVQVTIQPAESQYTIVMTTGTSDTFTSDISGIKWEIDPGIGELQPKSNQKFNATVYASKGNLESCKLELINATNLSQALASDTSVSNGTYCFTDLTYTTVKGVRYFGKLSLDTTNSTGYFVVDSDFMWVIWDIKNGSSNLKFTSLFNDIRSISDFGTGTEGEFGRLVMFFLIMTMIIGVFTFFSGVELSNPGVSIILIWVIVFFASVGGFFTYTSGASNLTAGTTTWFATYGLLIVYTILTAGYIFSLFRRTATQ